MDLKSAVLLGSPSGRYVAQHVAIGIPHRVTPERVASDLAGFVFGLILTAAPTQARQPLRNRPTITPP